MKHLYQQFENESLLLLYMAGELPEQDRAELDLMLERDGGMRAQLASLRSAQAKVYQELSQLDATEPLRSPEVAIRNVGRAMQQWQIDRLARPLKSAAPRSRMPLIAWSAGSAVAALLVFCIWWGFRADFNTNLSSTQPSSGSNLTTGPGGAPGDLAMNTPPGQATPNPADNPDDSSDQDSDTDGSNGTANGAVQIVTVDASSQRLADLESAVKEDFVQ